MPEYINTSSNGSFSKGQVYKNGDIAIFPEAYGKTKAKTWKLKSEYDKEIAEQMEADATNEHPDDAVKRLTAELAAAKKVITKAKKTKEQNPGADEAPKAPEAPKFNIGSEDTTDPTDPIDITNLSWPQMLKKAKELGFAGELNKVNVEKFLKSKSGE